MADLPPGQREIESFPRFGLIQYAKRFKTDFGPLQLKIGGKVKKPLQLSAQDLNHLPRISQTSDFHCVTTWSKKNLSWSGYRFKDLFQQLIQKQSEVSSNCKFVIFRALDGYRSIIYLEDLLSDDVLLADRLNDSALSAKHGATLRLIMPAHYGYKSVKHLKAIEFWPDESHFKPPSFRFMSHIRGRVDLEERGTGIPGYLLRYLYRPLIKPTISLFEKAMR